MEARPGSRTTTFSSPSARVQALVSCLEGAFSNARRHGDRLGVDIPCWLCTSLGDLLVTRSRAPVSPPGMGEGWTVDSLLHS